MKQAPGHVGRLQGRVGLHACQVTATLAPPQEAPPRCGLCDWFGVGCECGGAQTRMWFAALNV
ncbi:hypothetical protein [Undibacterium sp. GrIS 1.8]|uniref:hypothetical protein n=1 Tax=Undibacterium sp. GrIS 1.8 TaxID=3143934 RepID=UPI00339286AB